MRRHRLRTIGLVTASVLALALGSASPSGATKAATLTADTATSSQMISQEAKPSVSHPRVLSETVYPVNPDGSLGTPLPVEKSGRDPSAPSCVDAAEGSDEAGVLNVAFEACQCPPNDNCHIGFLVGHGPFTTTFVAESLTTGQVAVLGPTGYFCSGGCALEQSGGGIGWLALWWTVDSNAGAGVYDQWCT